MFTPDGKRTKGSIGTKEYGCSITTGGGVTGCTYYNWFTEYFAGGDLAMTFWGWTYNAGDNGTWVNASTGSDGDITGS